MAQNHLGRDAPAVRNVGNQANQAFNLPLVLQRGDAGHLDADSVGVGHAVTAPDPDMVGFTRLVGDEGNCPIPQIVNSE